MSREVTAFGTVTEAAGRGAVYEGHGPQALYDEATHTTYVAYRGPDADPHATAFDHETGAFAAPTRIGTNPLRLDDNHGPPAICLDPDGYIYAFYGSNGSPHQLARTRDPYDVSDWVALGELDDVPSGSYPHPRVSPDGTIYVLYRAWPDHEPGVYPTGQYGTIARSTDGGETFEDLGPIIDTSGHPDELSSTYVKDCTLADGAVHMSWFICRDHAMPTTAASQHRYGIFHATYDVAADAVVDMAGTRYDPPITWTEMDGSPAEALGRIDVNHPKHVLTADGPAILYTHYDPPSVGFDDGTSRIEWLVTRWDGDRWATDRLPDAFATHLFDGGYPRINEDGELEAHVITGGDDPDLVDGGRGGNFEVFARSSDGWERRGGVTAAAAGTPLSRVSTVANGRDDFASLVVPASGDATDFDLPLYAYGDAWNATGT